MNLLKHTTIIISGSRNAPAFECFGSFLIEWLKSPFVYVAETRSASLSAGFVVFSTPLHKYLRVFSSYLRL